MGIVHSIMVSNPKTPYEYSPKDHWLTEEYVNKYIEVFQDQLNADARHVEQCLRASTAGSLWFTNAHVLRLRISENAYGVLSQDLRIKYLIKNLKLPFIVSFHAYGDACISLVHGIKEAARTPVDDNQIATDPIANVE